MLAQTKESYSDGPKIRSKKLRDLIGRLESEVGPDRALDQAIAREIGWRGGIGSWHAPGDDDSDPPYASFPNFTGSIDAAKSLLPEGFWWRGGTCGLSSEMRVCPDHNLAEHRVRLFAECPPTIAHWNNGIEVELRPGGDDTLVRAFAAACLRARDALAVSRAKSIKRCSPRIRPADAR